MAEETERAARRGRDGGGAVHRLGQADTRRADGPARRAGGARTRCGACPTSGSTAGSTRRSGRTRTSWRPRRWARSRSWPTASLAALAAMCASAPEELEGWLDGLQLDARDRDAVLWAARWAQPLARTLREREHSPAELRAAPGPRAPRDAGAGARLRRAARAGAALDHRPLPRPPRDHRRRPAGAPGCPRAPRSAGRWRARSTGSSTDSCPAATRSSAPPCRSPGRTRDRAAPARARG